MNSCFKCFKQAIRIHHVPASMFLNLFYLFVIIIFIIFFIILFIYLFIFEIIIHHYILSTCRPYKHVPAEGSNDTFQKHDHPKPAATRLPSARLPLTVPTDGNLTPTNKK